MRVLAKNELNHVSGATSAETINWANWADIAKDKSTMNVIEWKPDQTEWFIPQWTPNGSLATDAWEGLIMIGYLSYKHSQTILAAVVSVIRK